MNKQKCYNCNKEFELDSNRPVAKYCDRKCYKQSMEAGMTPPPITGEYAPFDSGKSERRRASDFDTYFLGNE